MILRKLFPVISILFLFAFSNSLKAKEIMVKDKANLEDAISKALPGDEIVLANGVWKDVEVEFTAEGTQEKPIVLRAETPGKVFIEGISFLKFGGDYLQVSGLHFFGMVIHLQMPLLSLN